MREEAQAQRELEQAIRDAEREEARYEKALERARQEVERSSGAAHEALPQPGPDDEIGTRLCDFEHRLIRRERCTRSA
jgi:hypothetical protein